MRRVPDCSLWLGHAGDGRDLRAVHRAGLLALVDLAVNEPPVAVTRELAYCRFPLVDSPGNPPWLLRAAVETTAGLLRAEVPTLLFCANGMSRTPAVAAAAIALARGLAPEEALALVAKAGPHDVSPGLWQEVRAVVTSRPCDPAAPRSSSAAPPPP
jgi:protein-tyrosine phosphatase